MGSSEPAYGLSTEYNLTHSYLLADTSHDRPFVSLLLATYLPRPDTIYAKLCLGNDDRCSQPFHASYTTHVFQNDEKHSAQYHADII